MVSRTCKTVRDNGEPCRAAPLRDGDFCRMHSPDHVGDVQEGRRIGGLRRRKEVTLQAAYEFDGPGTVPDIRRVVEIAVLDALSMENSIARGRLLIAAAQVAGKLLETGELEDRIERIEAVLGPKLAKGRR